MLHPSFHKLLLPSTVQPNQQLRLPDNFMRKYGGELLPIVTLSVPDGSVWRVGLKKADNKYWFLDGWKEFVKRYSISIGYLLVFRYEGKSSFNVHIFNLATSEINYQAATRSSNEGLHFTNRLKLFEEMEDEDSIEISDSSPSHLAPSSLQNQALAGSVDKMTPGKSYTPPALQNLFNGSKLNSINWGEGGNAHSSRSANSLDNRLTRDIGLQFNAVEFKRATEELKLRASIEERMKKTTRKKRKSDLPFSNKALLSKDFPKPTSSVKIESSEACKLVESFTSRNPHWKHLMTKCNVEDHCTLHIATEFACKYIPEAVKQIILWNSEGKFWEVEVACLRYQNKRYTQFTTGWGKFVCDNKVMKGDTCIFELEDQNHLSVHIFRTSV